MERCVLKVDGLCKSYKDFALKDISFSLEEGYILGIIGRNGAGKSTTFKSVLGLIYPDSGNIEMLGKKLSEVTPEDKEQLGVVLAEANACEMFNAKDMLPILKAMYKSFSEQEYLAKCKQYDIPMNKPIKEFSTGMKAKFKIIMALSHNAKLLILDEATSSIDTHTEILIQRALETLLKGRTSFIIAHRLSTIRSADHILVLDGGKIAAMGNHETLLQTPRASLDSQ